MRGVNVNMFYDDLNTEEQVSYLIKPILQVLQEAGGQLERSEIRDRISELDEHIAEFEQKLYTSNKTGNQYKKFDFKFNFAIKELSYVGLISYVKFNPKITLTQDGANVDLTDFDVKTEVRDKARSYWEEHSTKNKSKNKPVETLEVEDEENESTDDELLDDFKVKLQSAIANMSPAKFEQFSRALLTKMGVEFTNKGVQVSNDGGIDGYGYHVDADDFRTTRVVIQCKRFNSNPVSEPDINQFLGAMNKYQADYGVFITNSRFTNKAREAAREGTPITLIDGNDLILTPGFIDSHVHVLGGGGEGGFANRTPEATMEGLTKFGVTTVVGCLGTDGIGRDMCALVAKTKGLNEQGMSAYCYTGSYQIPVRTLTDSIVKDIMMIQEIIGTGEIAISDHRSSQPTFEEFARVVADTRLGGVLSGKAGIVNVHLGDSPRCLDLIERVVDETEIPASQILPTHINRNEMLFGKSIEYALKGGAVDFTGNEDIDYWETICDEVRVCNGIKRMLDAGVNPDRITISSDGQGSLPMYSSDGKFLGMGVGQSSCLLKEVKECVFKTEIPLEIAISTITSNPADILCLKGKGKVEEGYDADLCILDQELQLVEVIAKGNTVYTK